MHKYKPKLGDWIWTKSIVPGNDEEVKKKATKARIIKINKEKNIVQVEYGDYFDWAWVSLSSCDFIEHGQKHSLDNRENNPYIFT